MPKRSLSEIVGDLLPEPAAEFLSSGLFDVVEKYLTNQGFPPMPIEGDALPATGTRSYAVHDARGRRLTFSIAVQVPK